MIDSLYNLSKSLLKCQKIKGSIILFTSLFAKTHSICYCKAESLRRNKRSFILFAKTHSICYCKAESLRRNKRSFIWYRVNKRFFVLAAAGTERRKHMGKWVYWTTGFQVLTRLVWSCDNSTKNSAWKCTLYPLFFKHANDSCRKRTEYLAWFSVWNVML